jgi:hypothetical protein
MSQVCLSYKQDLFSIAQDDFRMTTAHDAKQKAHRGPHIAVECSLLLVKRSDCDLSLRGPALALYSGIADVFLKA